MAADEQERLLKARGCWGHIRLSEYRTCDRGTRMCANPDHRPKTREDEIDEYLDDLREIWLRAPDLRLGQLVANLATPNMAPGNGEQRFCAVFYISDHKLLRTGVWWEEEAKEED